MAGDLISRSALLAAYDAAHEGPPGGARKLMENAPAVDAAPVVHAQWKRTDAYPHWLYCSNCYKRIVPNDEWIEQYNIPTTYCPNCGAKMYNTACGPDYCEIGGDEDADGKRTVSG